MVAAAVRLSPWDEVNGQDGVVARIGQGILDALQEPFDQIATAHARASRS
jgi:hypothetical protein